MSDDILRNSAALNALKRHQLVSLSKKYGLKANGKNVEMVERLQEYAASHAGDLDFYIPEPAPTPARPLDALSPQSSEPSSPVCKKPMTQAVVSVPSLSVPTLNHKESMISIMTRQSWDVLSESGASFISPQEDEDMEDKFATRASWKSSNNGESMKAEEDNDGHSKRNSLSVKALASSISRRGSLILLGRSLSNPYSHFEDNKPEMASNTIYDTAASQVDTVEDQEMVVDAPPSPASTVGVPRRHSRHTLQERPSTVRLCSPIPFQNVGISTVNASSDELPFVGKAKDTNALKSRRSMAPLKSSTTTSTGGLVRKSMPALSGANSASLLAVYPQLPTITSEYASMMVDSSPADKETTPIPGEFPQMSPIANKVPVLFGDESIPGVSNQQFSDAAQAVLKEMNARLPEGSLKFGQELLKGNNAEIDKLVHVNRDLGTGGWGLSVDKNGQKRDRYAEIHKKEFSKMKSISKSSLLPHQKDAASHLHQPTMVPLAGPSNPSKRKLEYSSVSDLPSAPNGLPLCTSDENTEGRRAKRSRLSTSLASILGEDRGASHPTMLRRMKDRREKKSSLLVKGSSLKFGFLKKKSTLGMESSNPTAETSHATSSISHPRPMGKSFSSAPSARSASAAAVTGKQSQSLQPNGNLQKQRGRSTSTYSLLSPRLLKSSKRSKIPDFAPSAYKKTVPNQASLDTTNTLGLPRPSSLIQQRSSFFSTSSSAERVLKRQSHADLLKTARQAPPPPCARVLEQKSRPVSETFPKQASSISSSVQLQKTEQKTRVLSTVRCASSTSTFMPNPKSERNDKPPSSEAAQSVTSPPSSLHRQSTLYLPTAASIARMQATVKPRADRPLPKIPQKPSSTKIVSAPVHRPVWVNDENENENLDMLGAQITIGTIRPFGDASSRENAFEANFMVKPSPLSKTSAASAGNATPSKAVSKKGSAASLSGASRQRARTSGLSAVKSRGDLREKEQHIKRKKEEMRATIERRKEERELREMLNDI
ncbi:hypothetical protein L204_102970 [Cryptococcus depauperatus]|nr:hypothetical protein L204_00285 [Cryptococcus depauperatus CBS 7855]